MSATTPPPTVRRNARERQQAILRDSAQQYPGLSTLFNVQEKTNYSIMNRAGLAGLRPRFATLQHHLQFPTSNHAHSNTVMYHQQDQHQTYYPGYQHVIPPAQAALNAANNNNNNNNNSSSSSSSNGAATTTNNNNQPQPIPHVLLTIVPHAALTPQEIEKHKLLRKIGLIPRGTPKEIEARQKKAKENRKKAKVKQHHLDTNKEYKPSQCLKNVKGSKIEKQKTATEKVLAIKNAMAIENLLNQHE